MLHTTPPCETCGYVHIAEACPTQAEVLAFYETYAEGYQALVDALDQSPRDFWNAAAFRPSPANKPASASLSAPAEAGQGMGTHCKCGWCGWSGASSELVQLEAENFPFAVWGDKVCPSCGEALLLIGAGVAPARPAPNGKRSAVGAGRAGAINFGVQGSASAPAFPVPVGNTGTEFKNGVGHA